MSGSKIRLGLVDSGVSDGQKHHVHVHVHAGRRFVPDETGKVTSVSVVRDLLGHGTAICDIIVYHAPDIRLYNAQVFDGRGVTTAATVAAAIDWLRCEEVDLISLSLGLQQDRGILRQACRRATDAGIIMIASAPAQGAATYPASYAKVIRATGDARCDERDISFLDSVQADFGGCPRGITDGSPPIGGASLGAAHISGQVAAYLQAGGEKDSVRQWLVSRAKYLHNERRTE